MIAKTITGTTFHVAPNFCISRIAVTTEIDPVRVAAITNLVKRLIICPFVFDMRKPSTYDTIPEEERFRYTDKLVHEAPRTIFLKPHFSSINSTCIIIVE